MEDDSLFVGELRNLKFLLNLIEQTTGTGCTRSSDKSTPPPWTPKNDTYYRLVTYVDAF